MINVQLSTGSGVKHVLSIKGPQSMWRLRDRIVELTGNHCNEFYLVQNGRLVCETDICQDGYVTVVPRLLGGKGGFGSMLRAIGAQIEKTTNREACRDLSGRRLRDINEEKRLKAWIEKQGKREEEAAERKKKKLQRLCAEPRYEFKDQTYERERSVLTERVGDAVEEGFKAAVTSGVKRKSDEDVERVNNFKPKKKLTILDLDIDSDELDTSDDSDDDNNDKKQTETDCKDAKAESADQTSNDSGRSSEEGISNSKSVSEEEEGHSGDSSDNQPVNENSSQDLNKVEADSNSSSADANSSTG